MKYPIHKAFGIELEYMVVNKKTLDAMPIVPELFEKIQGSFTNEIEHATITWSNELVCHVIELKNDKPVDDLKKLNLDFQTEIKLINHELEKFDAMLLPTAMHPWMNPDQETKLWPHENNEIYSAYDQIFSCKGHGWANLQSMHINLSFGNDQEFEKLHAAVRLVLPLIPALSSSSPIFENKKGDFLSSRLGFYLENQRRIPSIIGSAIPEKAWSKAEYEKIILEPMYKDIAPFDTKSVLQEEWLNSRAAIPKFERDSIEIRLADTNENSFIDLSIAIFWSKVIKSLINEEWISLNEQKLFSEVLLKEILVSTVQSSSEALIKDTKYLDLWEMNEECKAKEVVQQIFESLKYDKNEIQYAEPIKYILQHGTLSERILRACNQDYSKSNLTKIYFKIAECLNRVKYFEA
jgi:glutamate---cysteine ligase / carboxylate-amine ligase